MPIILFVIIFISSFAASNLYRNFTHKPQEQPTATQTNSPTAPEVSGGTQEEVDQGGGVTSKNVKGVSNTNNAQPTPTPVQNQKITNSPSQAVTKQAPSNQSQPIYGTPTVNNPVPKPSPTPIPTQTPAPTPTLTPTPTVQEVENPRISFQIYWVWLSGVGYIPEYKYMTSVCLGDLDVVWGHFYIIDPNGQEIWNTGNADYRQKPCQNLGANGSLEGKPLGEYTFKAVFDEMGITKTVKATVGQPPL